MVEESALMFLKLFIIFTIKYCFLFVLPYQFFWKWYSNLFKHMKIQNPERQKPVINIEVKYSIITIFIQTLIFLLIGWGVKTQFFDIYSTSIMHGFGYELAVFIFYFVWYDSYFYWTHRLLHLGWFYKNVHAVHHRSLNPTPLASYSFHPIEGLMSQLYYLPFIYLFPMSIYTLIILIILTDLGNLAGHLGYEFLPESIVSKFWGSWITTPTHHNMHHQFSRSNYGLYWNGWDKLFKTQHPKTEQMFCKVKAQG